MNATVPAQRRICVWFQGDHHPLFYRADAAAAENIAAAFAQFDDPVITLDLHAIPQLRLFPCAQLFAHPPGPIR